MWGLRAGVVLLGGTLALLLGIVSGKTKKVACSRLDDLLMLPRASRSCNPATRRVPYLALSQNGTRWVGQAVRVTSVSRSISASFVGAVALVRPCRTWPVY